MVANVMYDEKTIKRKVALWLETHFFQTIRSGKTEIKNERSLVAAKIASINVSIGNELSTIPFKNAHLLYHVYQLNTEGRFEETQDENDTGEEITSANYWNLPCQEFDGLWDRYV